MGVQGSNEQLKAGRRLVSRRAVNIGAAWSVPVILTAVAAPTASASPGDIGDPPGTAVLGSLVADKGEDSAGNRRVTLYLSFTNVVGTNQVRVTAVSGGYQWSPMPTPMVTVTSATTVPVVITRPGTDNSSLKLDITYEVNGVETTLKNVDVKNVDVPTGNH
jgi:hypothetical protein